MFNIDSCRSYATEANLMKALEKLNLHTKNPFVVCNRAGRFTAIFNFSVVKDNPLYVASNGFMVIG